MRLPGAAHAQRRRISDGAADPGAQDQGDSEGIALRQLHSAWLERTGYEWRLPWTRVDLEPADVLYGALDDGTLLNVRILETKLGANLELAWQTVLEESSSYTITAVPPADRLAGLRGPLRPSSPTDHPTVLLPEPGKMLTMFAQAHGQTRGEREEQPVQASGGTASDAPALEARGISKRFGAVTALDRVNLRLEAGEVLGVVGDNGAGKSTLMKVLSGLFRPSEGEILVEGRPVQFHSPRDSHRAGIEMVYQDLALAGNMPIFENIYLGREPGITFGGLTIVDHARSRKLAAEHLARLQIHVKSIDQNVEDLSGGQRQAVAIARATAFDAKVVIMDEPTAALAIREVGKVLDLIKRLKEHGVGVILISHRMDDIFYVSDRVMALFHGRNFAEAQLNETNRNEVIGWIMGTMRHTEAREHDEVD